MAQADFDFIASSVLLIYEGTYDRSALRAGEKRVRLTPPLLHAAIRPCHFPGSSPALRYLPSSRRSPGWLMVPFLLQPPPRVDVRLIDFDHTVIKAELPGSVSDDSGARLGIRNLIRTLDNLLFSHSRSHSCTEIPTVNFSEARSALLFCSFLSACVFFRKPKPAIPSGCSLLTLGPARSWRRCARSRRATSSC